MDPCNFYRRLYLPTVMKSGINGVSWHVLGHTFDSRLAMSGVTKGPIAALLRHGGTTIVRGYAHLSPSHLQQEIEKVAAFGWERGQQTKSSQEEQRVTRVRTGESNAESSQHDMVSIPTVARTVTSETTCRVGMVKYGIL